MTLTRGESFPCMTYTSILIAHLSFTSSKTSAEVLAGSALSDSSHSKSNVKEQKP